MQTHGLDFFGAPVEVGDTVACIFPRTHRLAKCEIIRVTPLGFTVECTASNGGKDTFYRKNVVKQPKQEN
jgi:hypothetical protein